MKGRYKQPFLLSSSLLIFQEIVRRWVSATHVEDLEEGLAFWFKPGLALSGRFLSLFILLYHSGFEINKYILKFMQWAISLDYLGRTIHIWKILLSKFAVSRLDWSNTLIIKSRLVFRSESFATITDFPLVLYNKESITFMGMSLSFWKALEWITSCDTQCSPC